MKIFYDTEFLEDGRIIDLISIGMVTEEGREYYAVTTREDIIDLAFGHGWLAHHVIPSLPVTTDEAAFAWQWDTTHRDWPNVKPPRLIAAEVAAFILRCSEPELWADYGAYDHVALCQLFGRMVDLPAGVPMYTNDLRQEMVRLGNPQMPERVGVEHNALDDARYNAAMWRVLSSVEVAR